MVGWYTTLLWRRNTLKAQKKYETCLLYFVMLLPWKTVKEQIRVVVLDGTIKQKVHYSIEDFETLTKINYKQKSHY
jgi:hypothetical protein